MAANPQNHPRRVITSFMLRFIREAEEITAEVSMQTSTQTQTLAPPDPPEITPVESDPTGRAAGTWRGVVKHIQSGAEQHFSSMAEAENFIKKYIED